MDDTVHPLIEPVTAPPAPSEIVWLDTPEALADFLASAPGDTPLALDTEFERTSTFYPIPGLVQLGLGTEYRLVEPSVAEACEAFRQRLANPAQPKLLYAMSEDLELFRHWLGLAPQGVVDLQIGTALAGLGFSMGYARLVDTLFGETLDKSATRSDWLARPLSEAQQRYALDDVRFLEPTYRWLRDRLAGRGLLVALVEESGRFADELAAQDDPNRHYLKLRGGWALPPVGQAALQALTAWRERECQRRDMPRNRLLPDAALIQIAERMPRSVKALSGIEGVSPGIARRYGDALVERIEGARAAGHGPEETIAPPLPREQQPRFKQLKRVFRNISEDNDIPVELMAPRKRLEAVMQRGTLAGDDFFSGWRGELLAPAVDRINEVLQP